MGFRAGVFLFQMNLNKNWPGSLQKRFERLLWIASGGEGITQHDQFQALDDLWLLDKALTKCRPSR